MVQEEALYNPQQVDDYVNHLGLFGIRHVITASEDIYNERGVLLIKQGTRINTHTAKKLHKHHLNKPLDEVIRISETLTNEMLLGAMQKLLHRYPDIHQVHKASKFETRLAQLFRFRALPLALQQKLTVMSENLPDAFARALFCSWLAPLLAEKMELGPAQIYNAFLAGMLHDVGLVHLPLETVVKTQNFRPKEWQIICRHIALGRLILTQQRFDTPVLIAVQNHHEYCDGTGYPTRKTKDDLDILSQIIALCDLLYSMRIRQFEAVGKNLADALPFLQINTHTFSLDIHTAIVEIFRVSGLKPSDSDLRKGSENVPAQLIDGGSQLQELMNSLHSLLTLPDVDVQVLETMYEQAYASLNASGLGSEQLKSWLSSLTPEDSQDAALELQELKGLLDGAHWIFKRVCRLLPLLASSAKSEHSAQQLLNTFKKIEDSRCQWEANWEWAGSRPSELDQRAITCVER